MRRRVIGRAPSRLASLLAWLSIGVSTALAGDAPDPVWKPLREARGARAVRPTTALRAGSDRFEIVTASGAVPIFLRGVNLGAGTPGHFPGEFAIGRGDYRRWIRFARDLRANAIRVYALHPPAFYEVLREENAAHPSSPLWLFQEVWTELPVRNDFWDPSFTRTFEDEIRLTIDALHGNAQVRERPGHASGRYAADVSVWIGGWLLGREWEPYAVRETERRRPDSTRFRGTHFAVEGGTAMETWLARICDTAASYESDRYGLARPVAFVNWPTLDPMRHPTEGERGGVEAEHDEDAFAVDPSRIRPTRESSLASGFLGYFANYHVYPYYPDFLNLDPGYAAHRDRHGACSYAGYLTDLKAHTRGLPLLIGEVGVPTSRGIAHLQPQGIHHGGATEEEQGRQDQRLLEDVAETGCAGALLFALYDEWFKLNWLVERTERPRDRDPLCRNVLDPEESYGLIAFDPPPAIQVDGSMDDWAGIEPYATAAAGDVDRRGGAPLQALHVTSDATHLYLRLDLAPGALRVGDEPRRPPQRGPQPFRTPPPARRGGLRAIGVSFDVLDSARGDGRLPQPLQVRWTRGAEVVLVIEPGIGSTPGRAALFVDRAMSYSGYARVVTPAGRVDRHRAPFRPVANQDGSYAPLLVETNRERISRNGTPHPAHYLNWGRLLPSEWAIDSTGTRVEVAIPWGLLNVGDPSSRAILDDQDGTPEIETRRTDGIGLLAWSTTRDGLSADSLGPSKRGAAAIPGAEVYLLGPPGTTQFTKTKELTVSTPASASYSWTGWEVPITHERVKRSAARVRDLFEGMEARERSHRASGEAKNE